MRLIMMIGVGALVAAGAFAQDWYHERDLRFSGEAGRSHLFLNVRTDLEHVWAGRAHDKEMDRLAKTEQELTKMQADLDQTRWDNGLLNDVIDSVRKSSNDERLSHRDRDILANDVVRLKEFQDIHHDH
ncbi:MAG TPA: hypothetical protein VHC90_00240 [Bryobacteraceae bacterium]|nr:hypothetical protein [Bryobacteraceae bacterium]